MGAHGTLTCMAPTADPDPACEVAHEGGEPEPVGRTLVAVFASPVSRYLLSYGSDLGYRAILVEPDAARVQAWKDTDVKVSESVPELDSTADVVVTDHHRDELGPLVRDVLRHPVRWVGVMGNPRHEGPHVRALTELGVSATDIARVHRPIGLNIGSRQPAEIAIATLAGLLADRNGKPGGFHF